MRQPAASRNKVLAERVQSKGPQADHIHFSLVDVALDVGIFLEDYLAFGVEGSPVGEGVDTRQVEEDMFDEDCKVRVPSHDRYPYHSSAGLLD